MSALDMHIAHHDHNFLQCSSQGTHELTYKCIEGLAKDKRVNIEFKLSGTIHHMNLLAKGNTTITMLTYLQT